MKIEITINKKNMTRFALSNADKNRSLKYKAFTLIEILVVCAIVAILAAVVVVNLQKAQAKTRDSQRKADLTTISSALEMYKQENKFYPDHFNPTVNEALTFTILPISNYLAAIPTDPIDAKYMYRTNIPNATFPPGSYYKIKAKSETITIPSGNTCATPDVDADAKQKAGDFFNPYPSASGCPYFQVSSSELALNHLL